MSQAGPVTLDSVVVAHGSLMSSEVDGELVMMDVDKGTYYGLDPVAARIWAAIAEPARLGDVCSSLVERYDVDHDTCAAEVLAFVGQLRDAGLVTVT